MRLGLHSNVTLDVIRRVAPRRWTVRRHRVHNLITTAGLTAWAYNLPNSDGQVVDRIVVGDSSTAPALGDTALGNQLASYSTIRTTVVGDTAIFRAWIIGANRDTLSGETIREIGLFTANTGATPSSNKLVARAVVPDVDMSADTICHVVWNLKVTHDATLDGVTPAYNQMTDYGKRYVAGRIADLSLEAVLDKFVVGTSQTPINPRQVEKIQVESLRKTPNTTAWGASGAVVSCAGTVSNAEAAIHIREVGAAVGTTANVKTLYQEIHETNIDGDVSSSGTADVTCSITFANA